MSFRLGETGWKNKKFRDNIKMNLRLLGHDDKSMVSNQRAFCDSGNFAL
jgi:hypothetical protein